MSMVIRSAEVSALQSIPRNSDPTTNTSQGIITAPQISASSYTQSTSSTKSSYLPKLSTLPSPIVMHVLHFLLPSFLHTGTTTDFFAGKNIKAFCDTCSHGKQFATTFKSVIQESQAKPSSSASSQDSLPTSASRQPLTDAVKLQMQAKKLLQKQTRILDLRSLSEAGFLEKLEQLHAEFQDISKICLPCCTLNDNLGKKLRKFEKLEALDVFLCDKREGLPGLKHLPNLKHIAPNLLWPFETLGLDKEEKNTPYHMLKRWTKLVPWIVNREYKEGGLSYKKGFFTSRALHDVVNFCPHLETLDLSVASSCDEALKTVAKLQSIKALYIYSFVNEGSENLLFPALASLPLLKSFGLHTSQIPFVSIVGHIAKHIPNIEKLYLPNICRFDLCEGEDNMIQNEFPKLKYLRELEVTVPLGKIKKYSIAFLSLHELRTLNVRALRVPSWSFFHDDVISRACHSVSGQDHFEGLASLVGHPKLENLQICFWGITGEVTPPLYLENLRSSLREQQQSLKKAIKCKDLGNGVSIKLDAEMSKNGENITDVKL
jgi:hypothetical protein